MKFGDPEMNKVVELYAQGMKTTMIAQVVRMPLYRVKAIVGANKHDSDRLKRISEQKRRGLTDSDIARNEGLSKQYVSRLTGVRRKVGGDQGHWTIVMDQGQWRKLMTMAEEFGLIVDDGVHSGQGSVRKMLEQIALGNLTVLKDRSFG